MKKTLLLCFIHGFKVSCFWCNEQIGQLYR
jgi:hypothetical protein